MASNDGPTREDPLRQPAVLRQLTQTGVDRAVEAQLRTRWNWNGNLDSAQQRHHLPAQGRRYVGPAATFIWRATGQLSFTPGLANFVTTFDPPGLSVTSNILFCSNVWYCMLLGWHGAPAARGRPCPELHRDGRAAEHRGYRHL
jgi:hypothetical protein